MAVRIDSSLRALVFTLYEYVHGMRYEKAYAVPFEDLTQPAFHLEDLLSFLQSKMPSAFPSYDAFLVAKSLDLIWV